MEREVGGGIGMGNTCKPMAVSFQCMKKFTTNKKKIQKKKKKKSVLYIFMLGNVKFHLNFVKEETASRQGKLKSVSYNAAIYM